MFIANTGEHMAKSTTFSVRLPEELRDEIAKIAQKENRSLAYVIKEAVEEYASEKIAYYNAIEEGLKDFEDGNIITQEEFDLFLNGEINRLNLAINKSA